MEDTAMRIEKAHFFGDETNSSYYDLKVNLLRKSFHFQSDLTKYLNQEFFI